MESEQKPNKEFEVTRMVSDKLKEWINGTMQKEKANEHKH